MEVSNAGNPNCRSENRPPKRMAADSTLIKQITEDVPSKNRQRAPGLDDPADFGACLTSPSVESPAVSAGRSVCAYCISSQSISHNGTLSCESLWIGISPEMPSEVMV